MASLTQSAGLAIARINTPLSAEYYARQANIVQRASSAPALVAPLGAVPLKPKPALSAKKRRLSVNEGAATVAKQPIRPRRPLVARPTLLLSDDRLKRHAHPDGRRHPECPERLERVQKALEARGVLGRCKVLAGELPTEDELGAVHSPFYLQRLSALRRASVERLEAEAAQYDSIFMNEHSVECAMLAAGGVLAMSRQIYSGAARNGMALVRPAAHHAGAHGPSGFCLVNSLAVSAKQLLSQGCERILIVDWDVHHGDGTQKIFLDDPRVLLLSLHRHDHRTFPFDNAAGDPTVVGSGAGAGFTVNIAWPEAAMGDAEYAHAFEHVVLPLARSWRPQMILVSAGFDAAAGDPLGDCCVTAAGFGWMTRQLMEQASGKLLLALEGGYSLQQLEGCVTSCMGALLGDEPSAEEAATLREQPAAASCDSAREAVAETCRAHAAYWPCLREEA